MGVGPEWVGLIGNLIKIVQCDVLEHHRNHNQGEKCCLGHYQGALRSRITLPLLSFSFLFFPFLFLVTQHFGMY